VTVGYHNVIAVGASAGGVEALCALVGGLPADFRGVVLVVLHLPRNAPSALPAILSRSGALVATTAVDGEPLSGGRIYVAPSDAHMVVVDKHIRLTRGPAEHGHRPAVDPLFRSVARAFGPRTIGVILSGSRDDGAAGLASIAEHGGGTIVQDPADARYPWMPQAALGRVVPNQLAPASKIGDILAGMSSRPRIEDAPPATIRNPDMLEPEMALDLEGALFAALGALEEKAALSRRMAASRMSRHAATGMRFQDLANDADDAGVTIRRAIAWIGAACTDAHLQVARPDGPPHGVR
jgi:two-component system chemotaxis response regulator CheB